MTVQKVLTKFRASLKREARWFYALLGMLVGVVICGAVVVSPGCYFGEGAIIEPGMDPNKMWRLVP